MKGNLPNIRNVDSVLCRYSIQFPSYLNIFARTVDISFEKNCMTQMVTVCQPKAGNISKKNISNKNKAFNSDCHLHIQCNMGTISSYKSSLPNVSTTQHVLPNYSFKC